MAIPSWPTFSPQRTCLSFCVPQAMLVSPFPQQQLVSFWGEPTCQLWEDDVPATGLVQTALQEVQLSRSSQRVPSKQGTQNLVYVVQRSRGGSCHPSKGALSSPVAGSFWGSPFQICTLLTSTVSQAGGCASSLPEVPEGRKPNARRDLAVNIEETRCTVYLFRINNREALAGTLASAHCLGPAASPVTLWSERLQP